MKIAIIDTLGLTYDGTTLEKRGLGGSESAVIYISRELVKLGCSVTVFNDCASDDSFPGFYNGVEYSPIQALVESNETFDVVIASRSINAFNPNGPYSDVLARAKHKVLWMHDTFCQGDDLIEQYINRGIINEIFTLTDWHTSYVTNCDHGFRRNFDVLKPHIFQTRNGVGVIPEWVDVTQKDPNLFVYNASVTKGMIPLVTKIWPRIKEAHPQAHLKVIGGFYRFREDHGPDQQEKEWHQLVADHPEVEFTGIITQKEISDILRNASYMLYPSAFPETFGISTLEAILHNVTPITCRFAALEETALDIASYKINYTVEKNWSCPWLDEEEQINRFVTTTLEAISNPYLHQQKMYACNRAKGICGWDSVALQWMQHFYRVLDAYLPIEIHRKAQVINHRVSEVFGRRFINAEMRSYPKRQEKHICIITPVFNAEKYIATCIKSVAAQDYDDWEMIIIDDASTDDTLTIIYNTIDTFPREIQDKFYVVENTTNRGAVYNQFSFMNHLPGTINMLLDGDDWLVNNPDIFNMYNNLYHEDAEFTYGSCWSLADSIPLIAQEYPPHIKEAQDYRNYKFNWNMPYTHLRTFSGQLASDITSEQLRDEDGNWYKAGGDGALFYALLELADPAQVIAVPDVVYVYNDTNPLNDYKINSDEQTKNAEKIRTNRFVSKGFKGVSIIKAVKKILIAIPCKNDIEADTFKSIYDLNIPEGYTADFQYFYGYAVDQVRNLIADWVIKDYDYLFAVDHDMVFPPDTLIRLLLNDKPIVGGLYIQRLDPPMPEAYDFTMKRLAIEECYGVREVGGIGMGCALIKKEVFTSIPYPQYVYHQALDHNNTFSEDLDFCGKARHAGHSIWLDTNVQCKHIGQRMFEFPDLQKVDIHQRLRELSQQDLLPVSYVEYMKELKKRGTEPKVIYDIGACVLHWTNKAREIWPDAYYFVVEGMFEVEELYKQSNVNYAAGTLLGSEDDGEVDYYQNLYHPGGNSVFKENPKYSPAAPQLFPESNKIKRRTITLDTLVSTYNLPQPDLIKIDVQGSELEVLKGAREALKNCSDVIVELQTVEYNIGAPDKAAVFEFMKELGFKLCGVPHETDFDGDYHFRKS